MVFKCILNCSNTKLDPENKQILSAKQEFCKTKLRISMCGSIDRRKAQGGRGRRAHVAVDADAGATLEGEVPSGQQSLRSPSPVGFGRGGTPRNIKTRQRGTPPHDLAAIRVNTHPLPTTPDRLSYLWDPINGPSLRGTGGYKTHRTTAIGHRFRVAVLRAIGRNRRTKEWTRGQVLELDLGLSTKAPPHPQTKQQFDEEASF